MLLSSGDDHTLCSPEVGIQRVLIIISHIDELINGPHKWYLLVHLHVVLCVGVGGHRLIIRTEVLFVYLCAVLVIRLVCDADLAGASVWVACDGLVGVGVGVGVWGGVGVLRWELCHLINLNERQLLELTFQIGWLGAEVVNPVTIHTILNCLVVKVGWDTCEGVLNALSDEVKCHCWWWVGLLGGVGFGEGRVLLLKRSAEIEIRG